MAEITAALVKELREKTDAPMMECKRALTEAGGDLERAEELLRVRLGTKAGKAASRITAEGIVAISVGADGKVGALVELNSETDFVAKNDAFKALAATLADLVVAQNPADVGALAALPLDGDTVEAARTALVGKIGENISIRRFERIVAQGTLSSYIHGGAKIGVLVDVVGGDAVLGRDLAMQIAASRPKAVSAAGVAAEDIERERSVARLKAAESGKSTEIVARMVEGSVAKFLKEVTLLGQPFVKDDKVSVEQLLTSKSAQVAGFRLYSVGEGLARRQNDFAAEVAAQAAAAGR